MLNYASAGVGTPAHLAGEMLNLLADIKVTHVPYKGAAPALLDVIAGNAQYIITSPIAAGAHMSGGRVRALATTGAERNPSLPDLPTIADTVPGYEISQTWGIVAPAGTPPEIVARVERRDRQGDEPARREGAGAEDRRGAGRRSPAEFEAFMANERQRLGDVIAKSRHRADRLEGCIASSTLGGRAQSLAVRIGNVLEDSLAARKLGVCLSVIYPRAGQKEKALIAQGLGEQWWRRGGSNSRPSHCERDALPAELRPHEGRNYSREGGIP